MKTIVLFGELMLRLKSEARERLFQNPMLEAVFGGSEANVAVSLSIFGENARYVTSLPDNAVGIAASRSLKYYGVEVMPLVKEGRLGIYYLEGGACQRPSQVIYDREQSCFSLTGADEYDWDSVFKNADWFHISGVTPAVSQKACDCSLKAVEEARKKGMKVSLDLNYRKKLWKYGKSAQEVMKQLASKADVLIANEEDIQNCLGIQLKKSDSSVESYRKLCEEVKSQYKNLECVAITLRKSYSADRNGWSSVMSGKYGFYESAHYDIENIVERVGAGDSFAAGLIFGMLNYEDSSEGEEKALAFATASSCLKHSIPGDFNLALKNEVEALMNGNSTGRIQR